MEPLLSVAWLWPEGWSLALRSRRSELGLCKEMKLLYLVSSPIGPMGGHGVPLMSWCTRVGQCAEDRAEALQLDTGGLNLYLA